MLIQIAEKTINIYISKKKKTNFRTYILLSRSEENFYYLQLFKYFPYHIRHLYSILEPVNIQTGGYYWSRVDNVSLSRKHQGNSYKDPFDIIIPPHQLHIRDHTHTHDSKCTRTLITNVHRSESEIFHYKYGFPPVDITRASLFFLRVVRQLSSV